MENLQKKTLNQLLLLTGVLKDLFSTVGLPESDLPKALTALEKDSQNGILGQRGKVEVPPGVEAEYVAAFEARSSRVRYDMSHEEFSKVIYGKDL